MVDNAFIKKLWRWFDENSGLLLFGFLLLLIPLYPKIPLGELIPGYIVRFRLEDLVIGATFLWWLLQLVRRKVDWRTPLSWFILAYIGVGLLSNLSSMFITHRIPLQPLHVGKSMLHWARHIEYFFLFFLGYTSVKNKKQALVLLLTMASAVLGVVIYGYGQKYMYWPVYSTMNREFSKGIRLYLGEFARVQSTFAGHYDLGAYLALLLPLTLAFVFAAGEVLKRPALSLRMRRGLRLGWWLGLVVWAGGLWLLVLSASRTSFLAYLLGAGIVTLLLMLRRGIVWGVSRGMTILVLSVLAMFLIGELPTRFAQVIDQNKHPQIHAAFHTMNDYINHPYKFLGLKPKEKPSNAVALTDIEQQLNDQGMTVSDTQPTTSPPPDRPQDVYYNVPDKEYDLDDPAASLEAGLVQVGDKLVKERVFSDCSLERSLSLCIRFETLWPRAIQGFLSNPLLGSGYATLTKETVEQFTEAESTDNNFLRTLGENGAIGFFFYYGTMGLMLWFGWQAYRRSRDPFIVALSVGSMAGTVALLLNAVYIDVFVASKVAYTFWGLQGLVLAVLVKEGIVAPKFNFAGKAKQADVAQLSALLAKVEAKTVEREQASQGYLSSSKRRQKAGRVRRSGRK